MFKLLIIGYVWPEPTSSAAGIRMMQLISFFKDLGYSICFVTPATPTDHMEDLEKIGVRTKSIELNNSSFDVFLKGESPEVVLFDRFMMEEQFGWRVSTICPEAIRILDTEDLHFLRKARAEAFRKGIELSPDLLQSQIAKREIASIYRCDLSLIISEQEIEILKTQFGVPEFLLFYLPLFAKPFPKAQMHSFEERKNFISIGNFRHEPNWDAVLYLKQTLWPLIRKEIPEAEMQVYGAYPTHKVLQLNNPAEKFLIKGRAGVAKEVLSRSRILLAPLRFGAGIKGKFLDAMEVGTPSITTTIGAEAMPGNLPWCGKIEDSPIGFVQAAVELFSDREKWEAARENGFRIVEERFSPTHFLQALTKKIQFLKTYLSKHREQNFTGKMLQHHHLNSTRYLSKYIEAKNMGIDNKKTPND